MTHDDASNPGSLMRSEIAEQPELWLRLAHSSRAQLAAAGKLIRDTSPELIVFAARGSSDHAAMYGQYLAHNLLGVPAMLSTPSTVTAFGTHLRYPTSVMLALSQSGASPDLLDTVTAAKRSGVPVIAFTNNPASALARLADLHVPLAAGPELSVAATKTYTAELLALFLVLSLAAGVDWPVLDANVVAASRAAAMILGDEAGIGRLAGSLVDCERLLVVGRGYSMATAREGALKLMETNAIAASGWSAADATHGPMGQVVAGTPVIVLTAGPGGRDSVVTFARAAGALGGRVIDIGEAMGDLDDRVAIPMTDVPPALVPLLEIIPLQQIALQLALTRSLNPDRPAGLNKVTLTV